MAVLTGPYGTAVITVPSVPRVAGRMQPMRYGLTLGWHEASLMIGVYARIPGVPYGSGGGGWQY